MANVFYNRMIRKFVVGFGQLFDNITLVRYDPIDLTEDERVLVPIIYAPKERYVTRLEGDPDADKKTQVTLPRMSFELTGFHYDASRKQNTNIKHFNETTTGVKSQYMPVPYDFDFSLYIYVRNIDDATQIVEHILAYFTPDYTIKINMIPEMGIIKEVPVVIAGTTHEILYEGDYTQATRMVIWTLNFTVKGYIFGGVSNTGLITHSITNILNKIGPHDDIEFFLEVDPNGKSYKLGELVYQGFTLPTATATARVVDYHPSANSADANTHNTLVVNTINGNFITGKPIIGASSGAKYVFESYSQPPQKWVQIDVTVDPPGANVNSNWTANTIITEFP